MFFPGDLPDPASRVHGALGVIQLCGVPVRFHFPFWLVAVWLVSVGVTAKQSVAGSALCVLILVFPVLFHEAGHAPAARLAGAAQESGTVSGRAGIGGALVRGASLLLAGERVVGLLPSTALPRAMASDGPDGYVAGAMQRDFVRLSGQQPLEAAGLLVVAGQALVCAEDRLAGILTAKNLSEFLILRQIRRPEGSVNG